MRMKKRSTKNQPLSWSSDEELRIMQIMEYKQRWIGKSKLQDKKALYRSKLSNREDNSDYFFRD